MGEVEEQGYECKICSKFCVSGRSLGGHMRTHMFKIGASKKATKPEPKSEIRSDSEGGDDEEDGRYQLNSNFRNEEIIKKYLASNSDSEATDDDQNNNTNYELRANPKKSWRCISDNPNRGINILEDEVSCKECGKGFLTSRALAGHMRIHGPKKEKRPHHCKKCGKGFDSKRAMYGHMRHHSKRSRIPDEEFADSLYDLEGLCPVRKKRSTIRYKNVSNHSLSNLNESDNICAASELEVAKILIMLSSGVSVLSTLDSVIESSDNGDFVSDVDKNKIMCEFDGLDPSYVAKDGMNDGLDPSYVAKDGINDGLDPSYVAKDGMNDGLDPSCGVGDDEKLFSVKNDDFEVSDVRARKFVSTDESNKGCLVKCNEASSCVQESAAGSETTLSESRTVKGFEEKREFESKRKYECPACLKVFYSGQALGGHKRAHYNAGATAVNQELAVVVNNDLTFDLNFPVTVDEGAKRDVGFSLWWPVMTREHGALVLTN